MANDDIDLSQYRSFDNQEPQSADVDFSQYREHGKINAGPYKGLFSLKKGKELQESIAERKKYAQNPFKSMLDTLLGGAQGIGNLPIDIANLPIQAGNLINRTEAPTIPRPFSFAPKTPQAEAAELMSGFIPVGAAITKAVPYIEPLAQGAAKGSAKVFEKLEALVKGNPELRKQLNAAKESMPEAENELERVAKQHQQQLETEQAAKEQSFVETGTSKPSPYSVAEKERANTLKQQRVEALNKELQQLENKPELPEINTGQHAENVKNAENAVQQAESNIAAAKNAHQEAKNILSEHEANIGEHLNEGRAHKVRLGEGIRDELERNKKEIQAEYDEHAKKLADQKVEIKPSEQNAAQQLVDELKSMWQEDRPIMSEAKDMGTELDNIRQKRFIPASDFVSLLKSVNGYLRDAYASAYRTGINEMDRNKWLNRADTLQKTKDAMEKILKKSIGGKNFDALKKTNLRWRTEVASLYKHPVYKKVMRSGKTGPNVIEDLSGTERGSDIIKNVIKKNPELLKHAVAQIYEKNPNKFYQRVKNEVPAEYVQNMPELQNLLKERQQHVERVDTAKNAVENAQNHHELTRQKRDEAIKAKSNAEKQAKEIQTERSVIEKRKADIQKEIETHKNAIKENKRRIGPLKKHIEILRREAAKSKQTLQQKMNTEAKIKQTKKQIAELNEQIDQSKSKLVRAAGKLTKFVKSHPKLSIGALGIMTGYELNSRNKNYGDY